jgi:hypothetical protein
MNRWEIFNPRDGVTVVAVPFRWMASLICLNDGSLDYDRAGEGWV